MGMVDKSVCSVKYWYNSRIPRKARALIFVAMRRLKCFIFVDIKRILHVYFCINLLDDRPNANNTPIRLEAWRSHYAAVSAVMTT